MKTASIRKRLVTACMVTFSCIVLLIPYLAYAVAACNSFIMLALLFFCFGITAITLNGSAYLKIIKIIGGMLRNRMEPSSSRLISRFSIGCISFSVVMMSNLLYTLVATCFPLFK